MRDWEGAGGLFSMKCLVTSGKISSLIMDNSQCLLPSITK